MGDVNSTIKRVALVDAMRGFALMALFLVHMLESYELYWSDPQPGIADIVYLLFMGKSFSLLALCFGFSFYALMESAERRGEPFTARFAWRLTILFIIGYAHALVYRGDIIQLLAMLGLALLLIHPIKNVKVLLALAAFCLIGPSLIFQIIAANAGAAWANASPNHYVDPAMEVYLNGNLAETLHANIWIGQESKWWFMWETGRAMQIMGLFIVGMVLGRIGFFAHPAAFARTRWAIFIVAASVAVSLYFWRDALVSAYAAGNSNPGAVRGLKALLGSWFELSGMTLWALTLIALWESRGRLLVAPFAAPGKLTLTLYIAQSVLFVPIFYSFGLGYHDDWDQPTRFWIGIAAIAAQIAFAAWWLRHFQYGPVEWVWRALTYWRRDIPFRKV